MAINIQLVDDVREKLKEEVPPQYLHFVAEFEEYVAIPNYRAAFMSLRKLETCKDWKPSERLRVLTGRFWHEVAE